MSRLDAEVAVVCGLIPRLCVAVYTSSLLCSVVSSDASMVGLVWYNAFMLVYFVVAAIMDSSQPAPMLQTEYLIISHHVLCLLLAAFALDPIIALLFHGPFQLMVVDLPALFSMIQTQ